MGSSEPLIKVVRLECWEQKVSSGEGEHRRRDSRRSQEKLFQGVSLQRAEAGG